MDADSAHFDVVVLDYDGVCTPSAAEFINGATTLATIRPTLAPLVEELRRRGSTIVLLSNEFDRAWLTTVDDVPAFDHVLVGSDNRVFKPDRRAFQRVLHVTGCIASQCLVIDDDTDNCMVAASLGCATVHFDSDNVAGSWAAALAATPAG